MANLLGANPELLAKKISGLKALLHGLNEASITAILEKTKTAGFKPHQMEDELTQVVEVVKAAGRNRRIKRVPGCSDGQPGTLRSYF